MPRDGSEVYYIPPGTEGIPDTTIESTKYNTYIHDIETDLNTPRPIVAGGTGANDVDEALANLGAEKSTQLVTNYDSHVWFPGSFYSAIGATGAPPLSAGQTATHPFVGWVVSSDIPASPPANQNVVVHARDQSDATVPGRVYVREKKAGVWGVWSIDGTGISGPVPPTDPPDNLLWWNNKDGILYVYYNDGNSKQWVIACPQPDITSYVMKTGDTMTGPLNLSTDPVAGAQQAATKTYVDTKVTSAISAIPPPPPPFAAGTCLLFYNATAPTGWTKLVINDFALRVVSGSGGVGGGVLGFSTVFGRTSTDGFTLSAGNIPPHTHISCGDGGINILDYGQAGSWDFVPGGQYRAPLSSYYTDYGTGLGGGAHSHTIDMRIAYLDVILCVKN